MDFIPPPRSAWSVRDGVTYLNHGSFGPAPLVVQECREEWSRRLERQPMDFFLREMEPALDEAMASLSRFVGADPRDMVFVDNATVAMNVVAENIELKAGDEVLLNDHEYGAVFRIWRQKCEKVGARVVSARLGNFFDQQILTGDTGQADLTRTVVESIFSAVTEKTKIIIVSHITSPSAIIFPVAEICREARHRGIPVCIDGPHAIAMRDINLKDIDCDFYCASLHKWLSAPFGSGFLYVKRTYQQRLKPHMTSWGRSLGGRDERWQDHINWLGTRDPAPFLAVPAAIKFLEEVGLQGFRNWTHQLAQYARQKLECLFNTKAWIPESPDWYGSMIAVPLPASDIKKSKPNAMHPLQQQLWERFQIEIPISDCCGQSFIRVSCHLYNTRDEIDRLIQALSQSGI